MGWDFSTPSHSNVVYFCTWQLNIQKKSFFILRFFLCIKNIRIFDRFPWNVPLSFTSWFFLVKFNFHITFQEVQPTTDDMCLFRAKKGSLLLIKTQICGLWFIAKISKWLHVAFWYVCLKAWIHVQVIISLVISWKKRCKWEFPS